MDRPVMDKPVMDKPALGPEPAMRCVGRAASLEEANIIAQRYEGEGYETMITRKKQGGIAIYEVWAGKKPDILSAPR